MTPAIFYSLLIVAVAFLSPVLAPHTPFDPATLSLTDGLKPPAMLSADGDWAFPLGTDDQGRDILSSIMYGTRLSLVVGLASVVVAMTLTAPGCGMGPVIAEDARNRVLAVPGVNQARVDIVWDPPWTQTMISEDGKMQLGLI